MVIVFGTRGGLGSVSIKHTCAADVNSAKNPGDPEIGVIPTCVLPCATSLRCLRQFFLLVYDVSSRRGVKPVLFVQRQRDDCHFSLHLPSTSTKHEMASKRTFFIPGLTFDEAGAARKIPPPHHPAWPSQYAKPVKNAVQVYFVLFLRTPTPPPVYIPPALLLPFHMALTKDLGDGEGVGHRARGVRGERGSDGGAYQGVERGGDGLAVSTEERGAFRFGDGRLRILSQPHGGMAMLGSWQALILFSTVIVLPVLRESIGVKGARSW